MKRKLTNRTLYLAVVGGLVVYALFGWFVLVGPKRNDARALKEEAASVESALVAARAALVKVDDTEPVAVADIFRLSTAMPSVPDMPGILLELSRIAQETGIEFTSISPQTSVVDGAYQSVPIALTFDGNFYELSDFLFRLRTLVGVRHSRLDATGRLFSVETLDFAEGPDGFPQITANLTVNAYVFGASAPANSVPPPAEAEAPAPSTTTPPADTGTEAAGATP